MKKAWFSRPERYVIAAASGLTIMSLAATGPASASAAGASAAHAHPASKARGAFTGSDLLLSVAGINAGDAWAVGDYFVSRTSRQFPLIERWARGKWRLVPSPAVGAAGGYLQSVIELSAKNAWAVGGANGKALIEHWNGTAWRVVTGAVVGAKGSSAVLTGIAASSARSIWAVGSVNTVHGLVPLIEHWNGSRWRRVPSPDPGGPAANDYLTGVAASRSGVWAVGTSAPGNIYRTLVLGLVRGTWRQLRSPDPSGLGNWLGSVSAIGTRVLAAGFGGYDNPVAAEPLVAHRLGQVFKLDPTPNPGGTGAQDELYGVAATSSGGWAVGRGKAQTLTLHEVNGRWHYVASPSWPSPATSILEGVTIAGDATWAVGQYNVDVSTTTGLISVSYSLILRWAGTKWIKVPSPNR
jgi:hypothetical protein